MEAAFIPVIGTSPAVVALRCAFAAVIGTPGAFLALRALIFFNARRIFGCLAALQLVNQGRGHVGGIKSLLQQAFQQMLTPIEQPLMRWQKSAELAQKQICSPKSN